MCGNSLLYESLKQMLDNCDRGSPSSGPGGIRNA
jgi:hypothetical protein